MLKIGLTGGIGCGKTTVANLFEALSVPVVDADQIARELVAKGQPALNKIAREFGPDILTEEGSLNRQKLKNIIFADAGRKQKLESILHPLVYQAIENELARIDAPYCLIAIPLLFETRMTSLVDRVLVVDCPLEAQIERVQKRDHLPVEMIRSIIASQVSRAFRRARADDLIDNSETAIPLAEQVKKLHNLYLSLST
ncbi:dephospho-CoA kinase [Methylosarcina fibrata]|uniref:dephospho-CoA kinase n=1 Tax=Methylosarcina fibrata TaxID=105972 RepID=UPI000371F4FA|nr:dephospho-CoA kinase [Methylosarcina fibrata]